MSSKSASDLTCRFNVRVQNEEAEFSVSLQRSADGNGRRVHLLDDNPSINAIVPSESLKDEFQKLVDANDDEEAYSQANIEGSVLNFLKYSLYQCLPDEDKANILISPVSNSGTVARGNALDTAREDIADRQDVCPSAIGGLERGVDQLYEDAATWSLSESEAFENIVEEILKDGQKPTSDVRTWQIIAFRLAESTNRCISSLKSSRDGTTADARNCEYCKFHGRDICVPARSISECMTRFLILNELMKEQ